MTYQIPERITHQPAILRKFEHLEVDVNLLILDMSELARNFADLPEEVLIGRDIRLSFPEFIGIEDIFSTILLGEQELFKLEGIKRYSQTDELYIDIYVVSNQEQEILIIFLEDVTKRMILEQNLSQSINEANLLSSALTSYKNYMHQVITSMTDALLVTSKSGKIKTVNRAAQDLFGYSEQELINQPIAMIFNDCQSLESAIATDSLCQKTFQDLELVCQTKNKEKLLIAFSASVINQEIPGLQDVVYIGRDVTDRQRRQQCNNTQHAITRILSEQQSIRQTMPQILQAICESLGWDVGELWTDEQYISTSVRSRSNPVLRCVEMWSTSITSAEFKSVTWQTTLSLDEGLAGKVWATASPYWSRDVVDDPNFGRWTFVSVAGLHTAFGFPILEDGRIFAVMVFFSREVLGPDQDLLQIMVAISSQITEFIKRKRVEEALRHQQKQNERLLLNILPEAIVERLRQQTGIIAEDFTEITVLFADIVGFTKIATSLSAIQVVRLLNQIFSAFDCLSEQYGLEKIKTIGDAYMVVGGLPTRRLDHASAIAFMALDMQKAICQFNLDNDQTLNIRIGIHSGPVVAGVIGLKKFSYDLWGDTVNIASRMESHGLAGKIQLTEVTYEYLRDDFVLEKRGEIEVKGKGKMTTYLLQDQKLPGTQVPG